MVAAAERGRSRAHEEPCASVLALAERVKAGEQYDCNQNGLIRDLRERADYEHGRRDRCAGHQPRLDGGKRRQP